MLSRHYKMFVMISVALVGTAIEESQGKDSEIASRPQISGEHDIQISIASTELS